MKSGEKECQDDCNSKNYPHKLLTMGTPVFTLWLPHFSRGSTGMMRNPILKLQKSRFMRGAWRPEPRLLSSPPRASPAARRAMLTAPSGVQGLSWLHGPKKGPKEQPSERVLYGVRRGVNRFRLPV